MKTSRIHAPDTPPDDCFLVIHPNLRDSQIVLVLAWGFSGLVAALLSLTDLSLGTMLILLLPFPLVITYYGLIKGLLQGAGAIHVGREGFTLRRGKGDTPYFAWADVQDFFLGKFARSVVHDGVDAPHMHVKGTDGRVSVDWLPGNTGLTPHYLVEVMEYLRQLHREGWPTTPTRLSEIYAALKARDSKISANEK